MPERIVTYRDIQKWVKKHYGFEPLPDWITHCKQLCGLHVDALFLSLNLKECPEDKRAAIKEAFRHFGMLP